MKRILVASIVVLSSICAASVMAITPAYTITDLGTFGGAYSSAYAINDSGQVVGEGFFYDGSTIQSTSILKGYYTEITSLNNQGHLAGAVAKYINGRWEWHTLIYNGTTIRDLGMLGSQSVASAINDSGQLAGNYLTNNNSVENAFFYDGTMMHALGTLGATQATAWDINNYGQIVGSSYTADQKTLTFIYNGTTGTTVYDIGTLGGSHTQGLSINDHGQVTGGSFNKNSVRHAFFYDGTIMHDLGSLDGANGYSFGLGINNGGQVVGYSSIPEEFNVTHAFVYNNVTGMLDLNDLIPSHSGWILNSANDINSSGQIVGRGVFGGVQHAFLLTPIPEPGTVVLLGLGGMMLTKKGKGKGEKGTRA